MKSSKRSLPTSVSVILLVIGVTVTAALSSAAQSSSVDSLPAWHHVHSARLLTDDDRRRSARRATVDNVRVMFGGLEDVNQQTRLSELANQDMIAAVLEYNEMVLARATGNGSDAGTCWMRLNHNVTTSPGGLTELFRDQVTRHEMTTCCLMVTEVP